MCPGWRSEARARSKLEFQIVKSMKKKNFWLKRIASWFVIFLAFTIFVVVAGIATILFSSSPKRGGTFIVPSIRSSVVVLWDDHGIPTIRAASRRDAAFGEGFIHAQERLFQMDLLRRRATGELSELFGAATVSADKKARINRFSAVAKEAFLRLSLEDKEVLTSYSEGVNYGLDTLAVTPFEYWMLRTKPVRWKPEDSIAVELGFAALLQDSDGQVALTRAALTSALPPSAAEFFLSPFSEWSATLDRSDGIRPHLPEPNEFEIRSRPPSSQGNASVHLGRSDWATQNRVIEQNRVPIADRAVSGSNCWVVGGPATKAGVPIIANDLHLGLRVPNHWFVLSVQLASGDGTTRTVTGITLPGTIPIVAGSNGYVSWGITTAFTKSCDVVRFEEDPAGQRYRTPDGWRNFDVRKERIQVKGGRTAEVDIRSTIWGPVSKAKFDGQSVALIRTTDFAEGYNMNRMKLEASTSCAEAMTLAASCGAPALSYLIADKANKIGFTVSGPIPKRQNAAGPAIGSGTDRTVGWDGFAGVDQHPAIYGAPDSYLWAANNRTVGGEAGKLLGDGGYVNGARARQIRDDLAVLRNATETDMHKIQLDDRGVFLERWVAALNDLLHSQPAQGKEKWKPIENTLQAWDGRAGVDSAAYRITREFRQAVAKRVLEPLLEDCPKIYPEFDFHDFDYEDALWAVVSTKPLHLLSSRYSTWDDLLSSALDEVTSQIERAGTTPSKWTMGKLNRLSVHHPLSSFLGPLGKFLDLPAVELPGDIVNMPRVQSANFGASVRFAVSPGREELGYISMPGGQSGHPLSANYRDLVQGWINGSGVPFLPLRAAHKVAFEPSGAQAK
jgi:penicillin amidase